MNKIEDPRIAKKENRWTADCQCGKTLLFAQKAAAIRMLSRGTCRNCKRDYRSVLDGKFLIYQNSDRKWCSTCSGCGKEQAYTRKDHAKQSSLNDRQCYQCVADAGRLSNNHRVGPKQKMFNKFVKAAKYRGIEWNLTLDQMFKEYEGYCSLSGWEISITGNRPTASLDRIDSGLGYVESNVQWVHVMVNMAKNKYSQEVFLKMCIDIAARQTK